MYDRWAKQVGSVRKIRVLEKSVPVSALEAKAHELIASLDPSKLLAIVQLLEVMIEDEGDELTEEDRRLVEDSREYFRHNPEGGMSFEQLVTDCGFTLDQLAKHKAD